MHGDGRGFGGVFLTILWLKVRSSVTSWTSFVKSLFKTLLHLSHRGNTENMSNPFVGIRRKSINLHFEGGVHKAHAFGWIAQPAYGDPCMDNWTASDRLRVTNVQRAWEGKPMAQFVVSLLDYGVVLDVKFLEGQCVYAVPEDWKQPVIYESQTDGWQLVGRLKKVGRSWTLGPRSTSSRSPSDGT